MNVYLAKFIMYFEIHRMHREGHSISQISQHLVINRRTVSKYLAMSETEYEHFLIRQSERKKILLAYEDFVKERLERFQATSAAQMHDWLKEHFEDFPRVSPKTVFNFVCFVRGKHNLPRTKPQRQHHPVEETPYGKQAQVDFGEYNLRSFSGKRVKVFFFTLVLSRSRFKFIWFTDRYFTTQLAIQAHELSFAYIRGIPDEIVYDQDKVFLVSENKGDFILTDHFRAYVREKPFSLHFCRKADPQSKGKVENVVRYVKQNFLYNRTFHNTETLNEETLGWLTRTANGLPHAFTQKDPHGEWLIEQPFLRPYSPRVPKAALRTYTVRKDNTISFKGNFYSLPLGTYQGRGTLVAVSTEPDELVICDSQGQSELCRHSIATGKGLKIFNTDHKRDKSSPINEMIEQLCVLMPDPQKARQWFTTLRNDKPRYIRDQLMMVRQTIRDVDPTVLSQVLDYCQANEITSAADFKAILAHYQGPLPEGRKHDTKVVPLNPLSGVGLPDGALKQPDKSSIQDYQSILKKS